MPRVTKAGLIVSGQDQDPQQTDLASKVLGVENIEDFSAFLKLPEVLLHFVSFTDGRLFSVAHLMREQGYKGKLVAVGHILPDQCHFAMRCGIDEVQFESQQRAERAKNLLQPFTDSYQ